ncbi:Wzz/FepE/Etk N-terminal domain-containing protein [Cyclobacterium qasimii]|uniref:Polysaccharide chain length determinant N-terminal domain-containing protein n=2 Tax=Cyclobacterium qasimii TaxID=1350429 RepID=A0A512CCQ4_9BACT|nr:Wzz/FepE/Etk N-terminal domain-containing protein [Cyclobacterium qasimii]GEO21988.1 hypothetical protein CQA01_25220 [Cyclobacterium qasimii]
MEGNRHILDDKITFKELFLRLQNWLNIYKKRWKILLLFMVVGAILGGLVSILKKPVYHADTTFVLEQSDMGGMGNISGLASMLGINLGAMGGESGLFKGDNIMELYKSESMLTKTLLRPFDSVSNESAGKLLIERYIFFNKLDQKWKDEVDFSALDFSLPRSRFTIQQDSVLKEVVKEIKERNLIVEKPDRKLNIIKVTVASKDQAFSKSFNENLVATVNEFYLKAKTKKTTENVRVLQHQSDSVRKVLDNKIKALAVFQDRIPNPNPLLQERVVPSKSIQIDIQASAAVYEEIVKNLEISKINNRNNTPLIQIIDQPRYPLERAEIKFKTGIVVGMFLFFLMGFVWIYLSTLYVTHLKP